MALTPSLPLRLLEALAQNLGSPEAGAGFRDADPVRWIQTHFWIPEKRGPMELFPYQMACLREATRRNAQGEFVYSTVVWSDIKKSAKSTIAAAVGLWRAMQTEWGSVYVVANDLKQADSRVAYYMRRALQLNSEMGEVKVKPSGYKITTPSQSVIEAIPIDPKGEAGSNADLIIFSELWGAKQKAAAQMWSEMTLSPLKFGRSQRWVETYAGFEGESPILEMLYRQGTKEGRRLDLSYTDEQGTYHDLSALNVYANGPARLFCLWNVYPWLPWQTPEYYAQEEAILEPSEFLRMHRNKWASSLDKFVPDEWILACRDDYMPPMEKDQPVVLVSDAAISGDCFGVLMLSGRGNGYYDVRYARAWYPPKGGKIAFSTQDQDGPEDEIRRLINTYNVIEWVYDPYQLEDMAGRFKQELLCYVYGFNQGMQRAIADKKLQDVIKARQIKHRGDPVLLEHIQNANASREGDDKRLRLVKRNPEAKIDLAVCLSMGLDRGQYWQL